MTETVPSSADRQRQRQQTRFVRLYALVLVIAFSPFKALGQVLPFVALAGLILYVQVRPRRHLKLFGAVAFLLVFTGLCYYAVLERFWLPNYALSIITWSAPLILLYDLRRVATPFVLRRVSTITLVIVGIEALYGIGQGLAWAALRGTFDRGVGDHVWGTIAPPVAAEGLGSGPYFVILLSTLMLSAVALSPRLTPWRIASVAMMIICWLLASQLHSYVYFALALVAAVVWIRLIRPWRILGAWILAPWMYISYLRTPRRQREGEDRSVSIHRRSLWTSAVMAIVVVVFFVVGSRLQPANFRRLPSTMAAVRIAPDARFWKLRVVYFTLVEVPKSAPFQPFVGLGLGQYASRAAMMASGQYLRRARVPVPVYVSPETEAFILPYMRPPGGSTLDLPGSSWVALYGEVGFLGLFVLLLVTGPIARRLRHTHSKQFPYLTLLMSAQLMYLFLLGLQDVYWEYTQAVFPGLFLISLCNAYLRQGERIVMGANAAGVVGDSCESMECTRAARVATS